MGRPSSRRAAWSARGRATVPAVQRSYCGGFGLWFFVASLTDIGTKLVLFKAICEGAACRASGGGLKGDREDVFDPTAGFSATEFFAMSAITAMRAAAPS